MYQSPDDPWQEIPRHEYRERQNRARQAAEEAGLDGLVVYSRGGGPVDMHADALYLTNHYSQLPYTADHFGVGSAVSHAAVLLPMDGPTVLVVDIPWWRRDVVVADEVRDSMFVTKTVGEALRDTQLTGKRVGLVGIEFMTASAYLGLRNAAPETEFVRMDDLIEMLRIRTSPAERKLIRQAAAIGSQAVEAIMDGAIEGATEAEAVSSALPIIAESGAVLYDAACSSGPHAHHYAWERLPSYDWQRPLQYGDIFHVDCYGMFGGYLWDFGRTRVVGSAQTEAQEALITAAAEGVTFLSNIIEPGLTGNEIYARARTWLADSSAGRNLRKWVPGFDGPAHVGHGVGLSWCAPWLMPDDDMVLESGMYLAVEMLLSKESVGAALYEENGLVTKNGFEVLTTTRKRW